MSEEAVDDQFGADESTAELTADFDVTGGGDVGDDSVLLEDPADTVGPGGDAETAGHGEADEDAELAAIKARVHEMEAEAEKLKAMQSEVEKQMNLSSPGFSSPQTLEDKVDVDGRSIYVGNVDYGATAEELEQHFHACGSVNRVTILTDKYSGHPKGFAYVEFGEKDSVETAMALDESLFRGRQIKVMPKRTNRPGISSTNRGYRPRGRGRGRGYNPFYGGGGGGYRPRGRGFRPRRSTFHYSPY